MVTGFRDTISLMSRTAFFFKLLGIIRFTAHHTESEVSSHFQQQPQLLLSLNVPFHQAPQSQTSSATSIFLMNQAIIRSRLLFMGGNPEDFLAV